MKSRFLVTRLMIGVILINLFVYLLAGLALYQSRQQYELQAVITTQNLARSLAINVAGIIDKIDVGLFSVTTEVEQQIKRGGINARELNNYLVSQLAKIRDMEGLWVTDSKGDIHWGTNLPEGKPVNITDREYYLRLRKLQAPALVISKPVFGRITHAWSILLSRQITLENGAFAGVALGSLRVVDYFTEMFSTVDIGQHGVIGLRDEDMALIVRHPKSSLEFSHPDNSVISARALEAIRTNPISGSYVAVSSVDNIERTFSYQKVAHHPFYIFVAISPLDYLSPWREQIPVRLTLVLSFTLVTITYLWMSNKRANERLASKAIEQRSERLERRGEELERAVLATVEAVSKITEMRDPFTSGHEHRVGQLAAAIAAEMGLEEEAQRGLQVAGGMHDVGMITIPTEILTRPGKFSALEYEMIQTHAEQGYEILKKIDFPWPVAEVAHQHHERMDGSGYPRGLKGDEILPEARILAVADVVEAMSSHRPYRPALGIDKALAEIERGRGTAYDPNVADACLRLFRKKAYAIPK